MRPASSKQKRARRRFGPGRARLSKAKGAFTQAQGNRGHRLFNLWYHYSARLRSDVILRSDAQFDHFCYLEGHPHVRHYELSPAPLIAAVDGEAQEWHYTALVEPHHGKPQLHDVRDEELAPREKAQRAEVASGAGFEYRLFTRAVLTQHQMLIQNWRAGLAYLAACRELVLSPFANELKPFLRAHPQASLESILAGLPTAHHALYVAALLQALQEGWLSSDLERHPLSFGSIFSLAEDLT